MNAYEGKTGMVYLQVKLCDPCMSALRLMQCMRSKRRYINYKQGRIKASPGPGAAAPLAHPYCGTVYKYSSFSFLSFTPSRNRFDVTGMHFNFHQ